MQSMDNPEQQQPVRLVGCSHVYCRRCIQEWASGKEDPSCAVCRAPIVVEAGEKVIDQCESELRLYSARWAPVIF